MSRGGTLDHDWFPRPVPDGVTVGARSWIYSAFAFLHCQANRPGAVRIGSDTGIYHGTFFELGPEAEVVIGDFCALVGAIIRTRGRVRIGDHTFMAHEVVLSDDAFAVPPHQVPSGPRDDAVATDTPTIELGDNCWVGMGAILLAGTALGTGCVVGAGAVVNFAAPPYSIIAGNPARIVGRAG